MEAENSSTFDNEETAPEVQEGSSPSTPSALLGLSRKGLFGNSASRLSETFTKEPSPESPSSEKQANSSQNTSLPSDGNDKKKETSNSNSPPPLEFKNVNETSTSEDEKIDKNESSNSVPTTNSEEPSSSVTNKESIGDAPTLTDPPIETESKPQVVSESIADRESEQFETEGSSQKEPSQDHLGSEAGESEEVFVKKVISMDTSGVEEGNVSNNEEQMETSEIVDKDDTDQNQNSDENIDEAHCSNHGILLNEEAGNEIKEEQIDVKIEDNEKERNEKNNDHGEEAEVEEEEEETPKKRAKRTDRVSKVGARTPNSAGGEKCQSPAEKNDDEKNEDDEIEDSLEEEDAEKIELKDDKIVEEQTNLKDEGEVGKMEETKTENRGRGRRSAAQKETKTPTVRIDAQEDVSPQEEEETPEPKTGTRGRGRRSVVQKDVPAPTSRSRRSAAQEQQTTEKDDTGEVIADKKPRGGRGRRSAVEKDNEETEKVSDEENEEEEAEDDGKKTPRRSRGRIADNEKTPQVSKTRGQRSQAAAAAPEPVEDVEGEEEKPVSRRPRRSKAATDDAEDDKVVKTPVTEGRRSTRTRSAVNTPQVQKSAVKTPATGGRGRKKAVPVEEPVVEDEDDGSNQELDETMEKEKPAQKKRGKRATKSTPAVEAKTPSVKIQKSGEYDPYDMDTEMEKHPEPLKNIHMEVQNFGSVKYAKVASSTSKYELTEKAAESRVGSLSVVSPQRKERKSLAEMTPGKEKPVRRSVKAVSSVRKPRGKKVEEYEEVEEMDMDIDDDNAQEIEDNNSGEKAASQKGRKRKSEMDSTAVTAPKKNNIELPKLTNEEQWKADHPEDEHEPHILGARVYAIFDKVHYPAVIASERDGLGRFKVQFTSDKIVKDVPSAGIIPLRVVVSGKQCFHNDDVMAVLACPNAASADDWTKGVFELESMDEDGNPTGDVIRAEWTSISLDMNEWKDFIKKISSQATAIVTDNITTPSQMSRSRKTKVNPIATPSSVSKPRSKPVKSEQAKTAKLAMKNEMVHLTMNEKGVGKDIFSGKIFMLTSANRQTPTHPSDPFRKKNLQEFIEQNGGMVTEHFEDFTTHPHLQSMLVSDTPFRTHKYLAALARGLPCVSNKWLQVCGEQGECIDFSSYLLSAGNSIFDNKPRPAPTNPSSLLSGKTIFVHSTHVTPERTQLGPGATFIDIWKPIIKLIGGDTLDVSADEVKEHRFDFLVTDNTCADDIRAYAEKIGAPLVTSEWVIQTIINSGPPDANSHPKFCPSRFSQN